MSNRWQYSMEKCMRRVCNIGVGGWLATKYNKLQSLCARLFPLGSIIHVLFMTINKEH